MGGTISGSSFPYLVREEDTQELTRMQFFEVISSAVHSSS